MPPLLPDSVDAHNKFEDLSGIDAGAFSNPYDALIETCQEDIVRLLYLPDFGSLEYLRDLLYILQNFTKDLN
jgi:hypothetical protein